MRAFLASPRRRRRLAWVAAAAVLAAGVGGLFALGNTADPQEQRFTNEPVVRVPDAQQVDLGPKATLAARDTAIAFIRTAVRREHLADSWSLVAPSMRDGLSRRAWSKGDIPVVPYPAGDLRDAKWNLFYSYPDEIALHVRLLPRAGADVAPQSFTVALEAAGKGTRRHWLVSSWTPRFVASSTLSAPSRSERLAAVNAYRSPNQLGAIWLLVPLGLIALVVLVPGAIIARNWRNGRRATRDYLRSLGDT